MLAAELPWWLPLSLLAWAVHMVVFHGAGLWFEWCDRHGRLRRFKIRDSDRRGYWQLLPRVLFNQCVILLPCMVGAQTLGLAYVGAPHLGPLRFVAFLALMAVGHDIVQYAAHRGILHHTRFGWLGHGLHHSTEASKAISACFMSSADFFLEIVCPYLVPLILIGGAGSDMLFHLLAPSLAALGGLYEHSGYDFGLALPDAAKPRGGLISRLLASVPLALVSSHAHGEHHRLGTVSFSDGFGSPGICDTVFGTRWDLRGGAPIRPGPATGD